MTLNEGRVQAYIIEEMRCDVYSAGRLFSFYLLDAQRGQMRCAAFNEVAAAFYERIRVGKVYKISKADIHMIRHKVC